MQHVPDATSPTQAPAPTPPVTPAPIIEATFAFAQSCALLAAVEFDLFTGIAQGAVTPAAIAQYTKTTETTLQRLLNMLCAMKFLRQDEQGYALTPVSERFLVRGVPGYMGDVALQIRQEWDAWIHLPEAIQTGQSIRAIDTEPVGGPFFARMADSLFQVVYPVMRRLCQPLNVSSYETLQVADLGAGSAPSSIAVLEQNPRAQALAIDFPDVLRRAEEYAQQHGVAERLTYQAADLATFELSPGTFDIIFASHVLRVVGAEISLHIIQQAFQALKPGGRLVIVETYNEPSHPEKVFPQIVSLNMLVNTRSGDAFHLRQVQDWAEAAGFQTEVWQRLAPDPVLVATRPTE